MSAADKAAYDKAKMSGKVFANKDQAIADFKAKNAATFTNKFDREPATRPEYIPTTTLVGGRSVTVFYNQSYGGYGYNDSAGRWMMYDAMADAAMMSVMMSNRGYYYGPQPVYTTTYVSGGRGAFSFFFGVIFLVVIVAVIVALVRRNNI